MIREVIEKSGIDPRDIRGIGVTGYGNGLCLVDEAGNPVCNGIVSPDNRGQEIVNEARRTGLEEKIFALNHQALVRPDLHPAGMGSPQRQGKPWTKRAGS